MARTIQIGKRANSQPLARTSSVKALRTQEGWNERLNLVAGSLSPARVQSILRKSTDGDLTELYEVYDKMDTDTHFGGLTDQVKRTLAGAQIKLEPAATTSASDRSLAEDYLGFCRECLVHMPVRQAIKSFAVAALQGVRAYQVSYETFQYGTKYLAMPTGVKPISGQRYLWEKEQGNPRWGEMKIKTSHKPDGVYANDLPRDQVFIVSDGYGWGRWDLLGVYRRALSWWLLKVYAAGWWADRVEIFGEPFRVARYPQGTRESVKNEVELFLENMGRTAYALLPENINLQLLESQTGQGGLSTHHELIRYVDNRMAFTVLGQTDSSTEARYGSRARSETVGNVTWDIMKDYAAVVGEGFNAALCAAVLRNYGSVEKRLMPKASLLIINPAIARDNADKFAQLAGAGLPVDLEEVYAQTGTTRPANGTLVFMNGKIVTFDESAHQRESSATAVRQGEGGEDGSGDDRGDDQEANQER